MTTLVRWNPTRNIRRMQTDMDHLMESFFETPKVRQTNHSNLPLDVIETDSNYIISAVVAGIKAEDIDITIEGGVLSITGETQNVFETSNDDSQDAAAPKFHLRERFYGSFDRKLRLPKDVDSEAISASHEDGILTITLNKSEAAKPRKITVS